MKLPRLSLLAEAQDSAFTIELPVLKSFVVKPEYFKHEFKSTTQDKSPLKKMVDDDNDDEHLKQRLEKVAVKKKAEQDRIKLKPGSDIFTYTTDDGYVFEIKIARWYAEAPYDRIYCYVNANKSLPARRHFISVESSLKGKQAKMEPQELLKIFLPILLAKAREQL